MKESKLWTKWMYGFTLLISVVGIYKLLDNFNDVLQFLSKLFWIIAPFIMGILIAYILYLPCRRVESWVGKLKLLRNHKRIISIFIVYVIALLLIIMVITFVVPSISQSIIDLVNNLPSYYNNAKEMISNIPENSLLNRLNLNQIIENLQNINLEQFINLEAISRYAKGVMSFATGIFDIFVTIVVSIYVLAERKQILRFLKKLANAVFKNETYLVIEKYFYKTNEVFFRFLSSQVLDAIVVTILISIALLILNVKYAILLGMLIGLFNLIPYFGAIIAVVIAVIITIFTGGFGQGIWVAIIATILQQIDANIINPKITGNSLRISPLLVIFAVTFGGAYFGILGMFLAVPIMAIIRLFILDYIDYKNEIKKFEE